MMSENEEEELIRLNQIFKALKDDAFEVTDLIVRGINSYKMAAYFAIAFGILALWNLYTYAVSGYLMMIFWAILAVLAFVAGAYSYYYSRKLKKKYQELIQIHENLTED